jgi:thiosulfate/3-mercaptopyruvate sulfurtransferase
MPIAQLISPQALDLKKDQPGLVILDCRFALEDPDYGQRSYAEGHIAGSTSLISSAISAAKWSRV